MQETPGAAQGISAASLGQGISAASLGQGISAASLGQGRSLAPRMQQTPGAAYLPPHSKHASKHGGASFAA